MSEERTSELPEEPGAPAEVRDEGAPAAKDEGAPAAKDEGTPEAKDEGAPAPGTGGPEPAQSAAEAGGSGSEAGGSGAEDGGSGAEGGGSSTEQRPEARPRSAPRQSKRDAEAPAPVVRAQAKYVRTSARKARLVCEHIRGRTVAEARAILAHTPRAVARDWSRLLESAVANAEQNHELVGEDLYVKAVYADEGPTIKRFRPRAMGRATRIRKRTSHLTIMLTPKE